MKADVEGESVCVSKINFVGHSLADFLRGGGRVQGQSNSLIIHQSQRHVYGQLCLGNLSVEKRRMRLY